MVNFLKYTWLYILISASVILPGLFALSTGGLKPSIDFTGGTQWEINLLEKAPVASELKNFLKDKFGSDFIDVSQDPQSRNFILKLKVIDQGKKNEIAKQISDQFGKFNQARFESIGPVIGAELLRKTIAGALLAAFLIALYVGYRFKDRMYGLAAILAMIHDVLVVTGIFALLGRFFAIEVDTLFVTALLTIVSFSIHDTVVVYDRVRELVSRNPKEKLFDLVNRGINETMRRSVFTSLTILFMLAALIFIGGEATRWFALALFIGTISGTYSSPFVAFPLILLWQRIRYR